MTATLTDADRFELRTVDHNGRDKTDEHAINRWSKHGDRLYLDDGSKLDKHSVYVDLETETLAGVPSSTWSTDVTVEGDTLTVFIERGKVRTKTTTFEIEIVGDAFESDDEGSEEDSEGGEAEGADEPELACDGGEDTTAHVDDATIAAALDGRELDDTGRVRDLLAGYWRTARESWPEICSEIESGNYVVVGETNDYLVLATEHHYGYDEWLTEEITDAEERALSAVLHELAGTLTDYDWGVSYPYVLPHPEEDSAGQRYVEAVVNGLRRRGLSAEQAWTYYGVEIRGDSQSMWATRTDRAQGDVSKTLSRVAEKLPGA